MVLTHIYTGMKMFVWVCVTQGHGGVHPTAHLNTAELHTEASSSGLPQHSCTHTRSLPGCCHAVALTMIQSEPDLGSMMAQRLPRFVPTEGNFSRGNKQTMNSADLSEIRKAGIYIMHLHFLYLKHHVFSHETEKLCSSILIVALSHLIVQNRSLITSFNCSLCLLFGFFDYILMTIFNISNALNV